MEPPPAAASLTIATGSVNTSKRALISRVFSLDKKVPDDALDTAGKGPLGLTTLHSPGPGHAPVADIIFVHGLNGGSRSTWSRDNSPQHFWPGEWLPKEEAFKNVRVHTFGYPADITRESILNIRDFARSLLAAVKDSPCMNQGVQVCFQSSNLIPIS